MVAVVNTWGVSQFIVGGNVIGQPTTGSLTCNVASSAGNWLVAYCSWTMIPGYLGCTMSVADDAHGYWVPLGAPSGDSSAAGMTRCSIWARPASSAVPGVKRVYVSPCGLPGPVYPTVIAVTVIEVTGMSSYAGTPAAVTSSANASTSISANAATPSSSALMLTVAASDAAAFSSGPGAGWTAVSGATISNGYPVILYTSPAWRVASVSETASWSTGTTGDLSACTATILVANAAPSQPNTKWPATQLQIGLGSGALTPPSQITWTDITPRLMTGVETSSTRGKGYELDQTQAGTITLTLDNNDAALTPQNTSSPYYPDIVADVPIRLLMTWAGRTYSVFYGYVERWPQTWQSDTRFGLAAITVTDAWSLLGAPLLPCQQEQILLTGPYSYWPCGDAAGSGYAQNVVPGNSNTLEVVQSKFGNGGGTAVFGENSGINSGDPSGTVWSQSGVLVNQYGSCLMCADENYPPLTGGLTIMEWFSPDPVTLSYVGFVATNASPCVFSITGSVPYSVGDEITLIPAAGFTLPGGFTTETAYYVSVVSGSTFQLSATSGGGSMGSSSTGEGYAVLVNGQAPSNYMLIRGVHSTVGPAFQVFLGDDYGVSASGQMYITVWDKVTRVPTTTTVSTLDWLLGGNTHVTLLVTQTTWQVIIDGGAFTGASGTCNLPSTVEWLSFMGNADRYSTGYMLNGDVGQIAVFAGLLTSNQISQIYVAGEPQTLNGQFGGEQPGNRIERLAAFGGWAGPRAISNQSAMGVASISDIQGSAGDIAADGFVQAATGQQANAAITNIVISDGGWAFCDGNGNLCYLSRVDLYNQSAQWLLGENVAGGEYAYLGDETLGYDKSLLYNQAQLTQSTGTGVAVTASNIPSQIQHGVSSYTATVYQSNAGVTGDMANWIVNTRGTPAERAEVMTVNAGTNSAFWPFVLGAEPAQPVQVARRPITASGNTIVQAVIAQVKRTFNFKAGAATAAVVTDAFPEGQVLTAGDPTFGQLSGSNSLAWLQNVIGVCGAVSAVPHITQSRYLGERPYPRQFAAQRRDERCPSAFPASPVLRPEQHGGLGGVRWVRLFPRHDRRTGRHVERARRRHQQRRKIVPVFLPVPRLVPVQNRRPVGLHRNHPVPVRRRVPVDDQRGPDKHRAGRQPVVRIHPQPRPASR